jgi:hypothetical protein
VCDCLPHFDRGLEGEDPPASPFGTADVPGVCLLHVVVEFLDKQSGRPIQVAVDATGKPLVDDKGMAQLDAGGAGPHLQIDVFGTGFVVKREGKIITNHTSSNLGGTTRI